MITLSEADIRRCREIAQGKNDLIMDIVKAVAEHVDIPVKAILSDAKTRPLVQARWLICYIAHVDHGHGLAAIARVLKYKDHTGVHYGVQQEIERRRLQDIEGGDRMSVPGGATNASPGTDHRQSDKETAHHG